MSINVLSLGAGKDQLHLIRTIQSMGYDCIAVDGNAEAPGLSEARWPLNVSNRDVDAILRAVSGIPVHAVMAAGTEVPLQMARLAAWLGRPGPPVAAGWLLADKLRYKQVLKAAYVPHTEAHEAYEGASKALFDKLGYRVVVKPSNSSGSRGVTFVTNPMELPIAIQEAESYGSSVLMERLEEGQQISAETIVWDGEAVMVAFVDRLYAPGNKPVEIGGRAPSVCWEHEPAATRIIRDAANALGIRRGTIKSDLIVTNAGVKIIELTCRLSGGPMGTLVHRHSGVDYFREAVRIAIGLEPNWNELMPTKSERVAIGMDWQDMDWDEAGKLLYGRA